MNTDETNEIYCNTCGWEGMGYELSEGASCPACGSDDEIYDIDSPDDDRFAL